MSPQSTTRKLLSYSRFSEIRFRRKEVSPRERAWRSFEQLRAPHYRFAVSEVRKLFRQERNAAVLALDAFRPNDADWHEVLLEIHMRTAREIAAKMANRHAAALPKRKGAEEQTASIWLRTIEEYARTRMADLVTAITSTTRDQIRTTLLEGLRLGEGVFELASRIDSLFLDGIIPHRSEVIARTEVIAASNSANRAAAVAVAEANKLELEHQWLATRDMRTREAHRNADGQLQPIDKPFRVMGEHLMFPGDTSLGASAANIIMCRCSEIYAAL